MLRSLTSLLTRRNLPLKYRQLTRFERILAGGNLNGPFKARFYSTKEAVGRNTFLQLENAFAYTILTPLSTNEIKRNDVTQVKSEIRSEDEFRDYLDKDWGKRSTREIVKGFSDVTRYCKDNNIDVSDERFDKLVDGLIDNVEKFNKDEIVSVLRFLVDTPPPNGATAHNYHDMWSALDDICCWRMSEWDLPTSLRIAELWYRLGLGRLCDFIYELLEKYSKKPERLSKAELVYIFFYFNVCRKRNMDFSYENAIEQKIHLMNVNEIGIVAMGFFKTKTKVKSLKTLHAMMDCAINNSKTIHEITLAAIVKVVRMSQNPMTAEKALELLRRIRPEMNRLSNLCCLHVALTGTRLQVFCPETLSAISEKISRQLHDPKAVRLKDIERLLLALTMFDFEPQVSDGNIYELLLRELRNPERTAEKELYPKCWPSAVMFLAMKNIYPEDLIDEMLDIEFIRRVYGKRPAEIAREVFTVDVDVEIERPEYNGKKMPVDLRRKCAKFLTDYLPDRNKRSMSITDRFIHDVLETCSNVVGDSNKVFVGHVLPHFSKPDIVLCYDKIDKQFVKPPFEQYHLGDVVRPFNLIRYKWFVAMPIALNATIRYILKPMGAMNKKRRQLRTLGYEPILVPYHEFLPLDEDARVHYINSKINKP